MSQIVATTVYIGGTPFESSRAAAQDDRPFIAGDVVTSWSRDSTLSSPSPYDLRFTIRKRRSLWARPIRTGQPVRVECRIKGVAAPVVVFIGAIDSVRYETATRTGEQDIKVSATCLKGQEARKRFGDAPWPARWVDQNLAVIAKLWPGFDYSEFVKIADQKRKLPDVWPAPDCPAIDIDSRSPVEIAELLVASYGYEIRTTSSGLQAVKASWSRPEGKLTVQGGQITMATAPKAFTAVPARLVDDAGTEEGFDSRLASVTITYSMADRSGAFVRETSTTWGDSSAPGANVRIPTLYRSTQLFAAKDQAQFDSWSGSPPMRPELARLIANGSADARLDPVRIHLSELDPAASAALIDLDTRWSAITLTGAQGDIPDSHDVIGGTLVLSGERDRCAVTLDLQPASFAGPLPVTWAGFNHGKYTFESFKRNAAPYEQFNVTFAQAAGVSSFFILS